MKTKENKTRVIFRMFRDGEVIALFPHEDGGNGYIMSYMHIGQHGAASPLIVNDTTQATPEQYKELFEELQSIGYSLEIGKRMSKRPKTYDEGKASARDEAISYQHVLSYYSPSLSELAKWGNHFEKIGRRYGLLSEFRENGII